MEKNNIKIKKSGIKKVTTQNKKKTSKKTIVQKKKNNTKKTTTSVPSSNKVATKDIKVTTKSKNKEKKNTYFSRLKERFSRFKENPKLIVSESYAYLKRTISINRLFVIFVLLNVLNGALLRLFTLGNRSLFDLDAILADLSFVVILGSFTYFFNEKGKFIYMFIITVFLSALCTLNSSYYTFYTSFSSISLLSTARFITDVGDAVVENVVQPKDLLYLLAPIALLFLHHRYKKKASYINSEFQYKSKTRFFRCIKIGVLSLLIFAITLTGTDVSRLTKQWNREYIVKKFGIYIYHVNDLVKSLEPKFAAIFGYDSALKEFNEFYKDVEPPKKNEYTGKFEGKNIIVIHGESIQDFLIGLEFNGQEVTPNLNKLAKNGLYFNNFYTQVSVGTSSDTEFTFNTSLLPANIGTAFSDYADKEYVTIPKLLKDKGYFSFAMHGNNGEYWNRRVMHKNLGYDILIAKDQFEIDEVIGLGLSDVSFFKQAVPKLKKISEEHNNYYGTFIMLTNHTPFSEVDKYGEFDVDIKETIINENGEEEIISHPYMEDTKLGNYFKSAHYADYAIGVFLEELEKEGLLENTVIIFYGDHDARLPMSNYERLYNYDITTDDVKEKDDETYIEFNDYNYELNRKVPLIIWSKDTVDEAQTISYTMGMYDVMPTIGNMFGFYNKYALGHDIFNIKDNNIVIFPTGNWLTKDIYYNSQKEESYILTSSVINTEEITANSEYTDKILSVSNDILVYDLIRNSREETVNESSVVEGK